MDFMINFVLALAGFLALLTMNVWRVTKYGQYIDAAISGVGMAAIVDFLVKGLKTWIS